MTITAVTPAPAGDVTRDLDALADLIGELVRAKAFLATVQPPVTRFYPVTIGRCCNSEAEVDEIAVLIGAEAAWLSDDVYAAVRPFGDNVTYEAMYIVKGISKPVAA